MSTEADKHLRPWAEVARIWNERENENLRADNVKEIGRQAMLKLRDYFDSSGRKLEDMVDL